MPTPHVTAKLPIVLIVDDSRMVRASIARHLKDAYDVQEAGDGDLLDRPQGLAILEHRLA